VANEDTALKEVDQELAEERQWAMFRKYGPAAIGAGAALVVGVGAWQFWNARADAAAKAKALEFKNAVERLIEDESEGREALAAIFEEGADGYGLLAQFHRAASFVRAGERDAAIAAFRQIYEDGAAPKRMRELARIRAAYLALADGRNAVLDHVGDLAQSGGAFAPNAREAIALAALDAGDYETALDGFRSLSSDLEAPETIRERAKGLAALAAAAKSGVNIKNEIQLGDVLQAVGAGVLAPEEDNGAGPIADERAGHDREGEGEAGASAPGPTAEKKALTPSDNEEDD